ncbi:MAG TPA: ABC transporter ATP-binding protein, partial [Propionibacteriaceae bacterium]|nr:ABC transporter ATP-binding protein [Propionibacteriaceae bacterium]
MTSMTVDAVRLTKHYGGRSAVEDVSFTASRGEIVGLLGPNGAGKTTTIRLLTTVLAPTSGEFSIAGHPSTSAPEIRRSVGVLPESSGYPAYQTGGEYLRFFARLYGLTRSNARSLAAQLLATVGLEERAGSPISTYSRGMRQRLGIARALVNDPVVVFLDEPTLGLDPAGQAQVLNIIRNIAKSRAATVVLSTHLLPEVEEVCSKVVILNRGRVAFAGSVGEVISTALIEQSAELRVPLDLVEGAKNVLAGFPTLTVDQLAAQPDVLTLSVDGAGTDGSSDIMNAALAAITAAGIPVLRFELEGARLSDAFFRMT